MLAGMLCVPAFAAGTVLRVSAQKGSSTVVIGDYDNFQDGWNAAMEIAGSSGTMKENGYDRIIVDIYTDWNANTDGEFTEEIWNGKGFDNDTIYNRDKKVTLTGCTLNNNKSARHQTNIEVATEGTLVPVDCDLGDTVYGNKDMADLPNPGVASIFGEGSLTMIVVLLSLVTSVASMCMTVAYNKKKTVSANANHAAETEDEE